VKNNGFDDFDVGIMNCLQDNARMTSEVMAAEVGLSATACQRRMKRLRDCGAIAEEVAVISPDIVGGRITMLVQVALKHGGGDAVDAFKRDMLKIPEVQQCYYVMGDFDFILIVTARDIAEYDQLTRRVFFPNRAIARFQTTVAMENVKTSLRIPI